MSSWCDAARTVDGANGMAVERALRRGALAWATATVLLQALTFTAMVEYSQSDWPEFMAFGVHASVITLAWQRRWPTSNGYVFR